MSERASLQSRDVVRKTLASIATLIAGVGLSLHPTAAAQQATSGTGLSSAPRLSAIYDTILQARFEEARAALATRLSAGATAGVRRAPRGRAVVGDPGERATAGAGQPVCRARRQRQSPPPTAGHGTNPNGEAWFYLAGAYAPTRSGESSAGERLAAARDGKRIKDALERALELDPDAAGRVVRHRAVSLLRGRCAGGAEDSSACSCSCPAAIAQGGCRRCCARASTASCFAAKPTTSCTGCISGTSSSPPARSNSCRGSTPAIRPIRCSSQRIADVRARLLQRSPGAAPTAGRPCSIAQPRAGRAAGH